LGFHLNHSRSMVVLLWFPINILCYILDVPNSWFKLFKRNISCDSIKSTQDHCMVAPLWFLFNIVCVEISINLLNLNQYWWFFRNLSGYCLFPINIAGSFDTWYKYNLYHILGVPNLWFRHSKYNMSWDSIQPIQDHW
jgi:hypothetical protein